jgi:putative ABC transport system permease protein
MNSMRAYRALLLLLPAWFREEFASEMCTVFREEHRAARGHGTFHRTAMWLRTTRDVAVLGWRLHRETLAQDLAYALRTLKKTPAFTLAAIGTLALGLGPTLVIANFLYQVVIAPLPFPEPDRVVRVWNGRPDRSQSRIPLSVPDYLDLRSRQSAFDAMAAHTGTSVAMTIGGTPRQVSGVLTSADLHRTLGVHAVLGRDLIDADTLPGASAVIVLGSSLWRSEFGGRADVVGQQVYVDGQPTTIVGVLPEGLDFPLGSANAWVPLTTRSRAASARLIRIPTPGSSSK